MIKIIKKKDVVMPADGQKAVYYLFRLEGQIKQCSAYVFESGGIQVRTVNPYDDAEYYWATSSNGTDFKIVRDRKIVGKISVSGEIEDKLEQVSLELINRNKTIKQKMVYENKFLKENWRDGTFSDKDMVRYRQEIELDFGRVMLSLNSMIQKFPQYKEEFKEILNQFKESIIISLEDKE